MLSTAAAARKRSGTERIAHRAQERGVIIIKKRPADAEENDEQIRPHQGPDLRRDGQERFHRIEQQKGRRIEHDGAHRDEHEGRMRLPPESGKVPLPPTDGEQRAAAPCTGRARMDVRNVMSV